jgi:hypothetical protein
MVGASPMALASQFADTAGAVDLSAPVQQIEIIVHIVQRETALQLHSYFE